MRQFNVLDVVVAYSDSYRETLRLGVAMTACHHPTVHPQVTVRAGGAPVITRGAGRHNIPVSYPDWYANAVAQARQGAIGTALAALFFPAPRRYDVAVTSCGTLARGARGWGTATFVIFVHPSDTFKLTMSLPARRSDSGASAGGSVGDAQYQQRQRATVRGRTAGSTTATTYVEGGRTIRQVEDTSANAADGIAQTRVRSGASGSDVVVASPATDPAYRTALRSIKLERNGGDVSSSFDLGRIAQLVDKVRTGITTFFGYFQQLANAFPEVGWRMGWGIELFSGSLALEWGWKEVKETNRVYKWIKVGVDITLIKLTFTISFGARVLRVVAKVELELSVDFGIEANTESTPRNNASFSVAGRARGQGTLKVVAGWEGTLALEASVSTGLAGTTTLKWNPAFSWTYDLKLLAGKGKVKATAFGFEYGREWTFWNERELVPETKLMG